MDELLRARAIDRKKAVSRVELNKLRRQREELLPSYTAARTVVNTTNMNALHRMMSENKAREFMNRARQKLQTRQNELDKINRRIGKFREALRIEEPPIFEIREELLGTVNPGKKQTLRRILNKLNDRRIRTFQKGGKNMVRKKKIERVSQLKLVEGLSRPLPPGVLREIFRHT
jgi:tRNA(Ser,Leu) C12 N-acetylase TAN1